MSSFIAPNADR